MTRIAVRPLASSLAALIYLILLAAPTDAADTTAPTPKEQALMEHACRSVQFGAAHEGCLQARLTALRAEFGTDLAKLSAPARARIDSACREAQMLRGREGYVECLSEQLASLTAAPPRADAPQGPSGVPASQSEPVVIDSAPPQSTSPWVVIGAFAGVLTIIGIFGGLTFVRMQRKDLRHPCRVCGVEMANAAEMCAACRRDAAAAKRQAAKAG